MRYMSCEYVNHHIKKLYRSMARPREGYGYGMSEGCYSQELGIVRDVIREYGEDHFKDVELGDVVDINGFTSREWINLQHLQIFGFGIELEYVPLFINCKDDYLRALIQYRLEIGK